MGVGEIYLFILYFRVNIDQFEDFEVQKEEENDLEEDLGYYFIILWVKFFLIVI